MAINKIVINVPYVESLNDLRQVLVTALQVLETQIISNLPSTDMQGSRVQNVGLPQGPNDAVTLEYMTNVLKNYTLSTG